VPRHGAVFPGSLALTFLAIYIVMIVSVATVWLGGQTVQMLFLLTGWTEALILSFPARTYAEIERLPAAAVTARPRYRVMA
jgi:hypothetical protein